MAAAACAATQELLAAAGIAIGVAVVFGVLVANAALTGPTGALIQGFTGAARLQLAARSDAGFPAGLAAQAHRLAGVKATAPLLQEDVAIAGPKGRRSIELVGSTPELSEVGAIVAPDALTIQGLLANWLGLSPTVGSAIGAKFGQPVTITADGYTSAGPSFPLQRKKGSGSLESANVALVSLALSQAITGRPGRLTQVLVEPRPGAERQVKGELRRLAAGRVDVEGAAREVGRLDAAAAPNRLDRSCSPWWVRSWACCSRSTRCC